MSKKKRVPIGARVPLGQTLSEQQDLLNQLPAGSTRVHVQDEEGRFRWRELPDITPTDVVLVRIKDGTPFGMRGSPGRKSATAPKTPAAKALKKSKEDVMRNSNLLKEIGADAKGNKVPEVIMLELAREAESLKFDRIQAEADARPSSEISVRRGRILSSIGDMYLRTKAQSKSTTVDIDSEEFKRVFAFLLETFYTALSDAKVSDQHAEMVVEKFVNLVSDDVWEKEAKKRIQGEK